MITIKDYIRPESLKEAYELNQKKTNVIVGGMLWMKMSNRNVQTAIDLSGMQLDQIEAREDEFAIGAMCTLRQIETDNRLNQFFCGVLKECLRFIVGVQFRNCATIGGSIFGRFGFSDMLTCLLVLDCRVELFQGGIVTLKEFCEMPKDNDILVRVLIHKDNRRAAYHSFRHTKTDLPILNTAVSATENKYCLAVGARPMKATVIDVDKERIAALKNEEERKSFCRELAASFSYGSNMRGSAEYREHLAAVSLYRLIKELEGEAR